MKIAVISDTHGNVENILKIADVISECDAVIHLGDYSDDLKKAAKFIHSRVISVRGNNDIYSQNPLERVVELSGVNILAVHGHRHQVDSGTDYLLKAAISAGCRIVLYGHTHVADLKSESGVLMMNPGSLSYPRSGSKSYGLIESTPEGYFGKIVYI